MKRKAWLPAIAAVAALVTPAALAGSASSGRSDAIELGAGMAGELVSTPPVPRQSPAGLQRKEGPVRVPFVDRVPDVDARLDPPLERLPSQALTLTTDYADLAARPPSFRIGYTAHHLYLFVEMAGNALVQRDRAYQNGDGVILVLARTRQDGQPTDEFDVLGFSPGRPAAGWQQRFIWYRNRDLAFQPLDDTEVATASEAGRSVFEILVPWAEVYPYHPWLSDGLGLNLCVTLARPGNASARYCLVEDDRVDAEQSPRRYRPLSFEPPRPGAAVEVAAVLDRNHVREGDAPRMKVATLAASAGQLSLTLRAVSGEGTRMASRTAAFDVTPGLQLHEIDVPVARLPSGGYAVTWETADRSAAGRFGVSVLARPDTAALRSRLLAVSDRLQPGSVTTLQFQLEEIARQEEQLRPQDTAAALRLSLDQVVSDIQAAESGADRIATRTGILRRAFRSRVDQTLQPYSVRIPADYDSARRYPLLVYLHGSGEDDRNQVGRDWFPADVVVLAPRARGTSNWYTSDHAQDDIREAVEDVMASYSIDRSRVVLCGFSMGGYGVYRTFREDPARYRALAVFSGIPRVPGGALPGAPDFLGTEDLSVFRRVPLFIFHGGQDRNCPIEQTRALVARLEQAGAAVEFHYEESRGHETPGSTTLQAFAEWMRRIVGPGAPAR